MGDPIRVLHVFGGMDRGGAETFIMNVYRNIDRSKVQFDFMVHTNKKCAYDDEIYKLGGKIYRVPKFKIVNICQYKRAWNNFIAENFKGYKAIHAHMTSTSALYLGKAGKMGLKTIAHSHHTSYGQGLTPRIKAFLAKKNTKIASFLFACSTEAGQGEFGKIDNVKIIPNAIDSAKFAFNQIKRDEMRERLGVQNSFVLGHIGRFSHMKNHSFLIDVFNQLKKSCKEAVLLVVGDGELQNDIKQKVDSLNLTDSVIFTGIRSDIPDLLQAMDVFILPSVYEGLPVTVVEAQACGLPCLVSDSVTRECKLTDLVEFIPISIAPEDWAKKAAAFAKGYDRKNMREQIISAGFDVDTLVKWLEEFYSESVK